MSFLGRPRVLDTWLLNKVLEPESVTQAFVDPTLKGGSMGIGGELGWTGKGRVMLVVLCEIY